jgi:hypothetical protein
VLLFPSIGFPAFSAVELSIDAFKILLNWSVFDCGLAESIGFKALRLAIS